MDLLYIVLTYNRPLITQQSIKTLLENTSIKPDEMWILDDGSEAGMHRGLLELGISSKNYSFPINLILKNKNYGVGWNFEQAYNIIRYKNPKIVALVESDYIWRNQWMEDIQAVFDASPYTIAIPGCDHADMYLPHKTDVGGEFSKLMIDQWGKDIDARQYMYQPFDLNTMRGPIKVFGVSNSCGCHILHWERTQQFLFNELGEEKTFWRWMARAFHKGMDRTRASDAHISGTPTFLWEQWAKMKGVDTSKNFCWLNICDASIAYHAASQGINGKLDARYYPEGTSFPGVNGPNFPENYNSWSRC